MGPIGYPMMTKGGALHADPRASSLVLPSWHSRPLTVASLRSLSSLNAMSVVPPFVVGTCGFLSTRGWGGPVKKLHFLLDAVRSTFAPLTTPPEVVALSGICGQQTGGHMRPPRPPGRGAPRGPPGPGPRAPRAPRGPARGPPGPAPRGAKKVPKMGPRSLSCQTEENGIFGPFLAK